VAERLLHVSDLHLGRREAPEPVPALRELAAKLEPELVLATGDLAHRGRRSELERAAELLRGLGAPVLAVPGNHDIPYTVPARFTRTFAEWERVFGSTEPVYSSEGVFVVGLDSVRPWRQQSGRLGDAALGRAASRLAEAPAGALRVVALHHHLAAPPWRARRKRPLRRRDAVLQALAAAGAELVVGGHVHQAGIAERREFEALEDGRTGSLVLATVPGFGRPRPYRRGEARGVNVYEWTSDTLTVTTYAWDGSDFSQVGRRGFPRG
jgi:3',5'-cyclic AMP phosphodiesterase CpdA